MEPTCSDCTIPLIDGETRLCEGCRSVEAKAGPRTVMAAARLAAERVAGWSPAKRDAARRIISHGR